jgi:hypothetical protein
MEENVVNLLKCGQFVEMWSMWSMGWNVVNGLECGKVTNAHSGIFTLTTFITLIKILEQFPQRIG